MLFFVYRSFYGMRIEVQAPTVERAERVPVGALE
jgi:hypothetical protein